MESTLKTAYSVLPTLSRDELRQLQSKIAELLQESENVPSELFPPLSANAMERELDNAISEFDAGMGYSAEEMCQSILNRFGWNRV